MDRWIGLLFWTSFYFSFDMLGWDGMGWMGDVEAGGFGGRGVRLDGGGWAKSMDNGRLVRFVFHGWCMKNMLCKKECEKARWGEIG